MKRVIAGLLTILGILATAGLGVDAAPKAIRPGEVGPYEGTFEIFYVDLALAIFRHLPVKMAASL